MDKPIELERQGWRLNSGVIARLFSPAGYYPNACVGNSDAGFLFGTDAAVMAVKFKDFSSDEVGYTEMQWAKPEEIKLLASITLARDVHEGVMMLYPLPEYRVFKVDSQASLNDPIVLNEIKSKLIDEYSADPHIQTAIKYGKFPSVPQALGGPPYFDPVDSFLPDEQEKIFRAIQPNDHLMIRGLSSFLRSYMVSMHPHLIEEATLSLYVSLEASFRLVLRKLSNAGITNPSAKDAAEFVAKEFGEAPAERYFEDYYDARITAMHPESRFGVFPHAPLCADDCCDLQEGMFAMYNLLTSGRTNLGT